MQCYLSNIKVVGINVSPKERPKFVFVYKTVFLNDAWEGININQRGVNNTRFFYSTKWSYKPNIKALGSVVSLINSYITLSI